MSRRATMEFVGAQRRAYAQLKSKARKTELINAMCQAFGFDRKYANKHLTGNRRYKAPRGRGRTYPDRAVALFRRVWHATGCMCTKYLKATIARALANLAELEHVDSGMRARPAKGPAPANAPEPSRNGTRTAGRQTHPARHNSRTRQNAPPPHGMPTRSAAHNSAASAAEIA